MAENTSQLADLLKFGLDHLLQSEERSVLPVAELLFTQRLSCSTLIEEDLERCVCVCVSVSGDSHMTLPPPTTVS